MKARVKETGDIIELVDVVYDEYGNEFFREDLEILDEPDYWEKLKHQYAGMAMQGILSNNNLLTALCDRNKEVPISKMVLDNADIIATALVNRLKEEEK